jgi:hypothetical protein
MAWKCIRILIVVMMESLMLILEVQSNGLAPTSFSPSAWPIRYVHSSKLDRDEETLYKCFIDWEKQCHGAWIDPYRSFRDCIVLGATICMELTKEEEKSSPIYKCFEECQENRGPRRFVRSNCYFTCLEHVKNR